MCIGFQIPLWGGEFQETEKFLEKKDTLFSKPLYEIAALGAPTTGALLEGCVGSIGKGCRHRFHCYASSPASGFLGPQNTLKPLSLKDQPGVFPAPLMGPASLTFTFNYHAEFSAPLTPVIVKPDGTVLRGLPMTKESSPQSLMISSPAQTGIYTLFVLAHQKQLLSAQTRVDISINTQSYHNKSVELKSFTPNEKEAELLSAEFIYTPSI